MYICNLCTYNNCTNIFGAKQLAVPPFGNAVFGCQFICQLKLNVLRLYLKLYAIAIELPTGVTFERVCALVLVLVLVLILVLVLLCAPAQANEYVY